MIQSPDNVCANKSTLVVLAPNAKGVLVTLLLVVAGAAVIPWDLNRKAATRIRVNAIVILVSLESLATNAYPDSGDSRRTAAQVNQKLFQIRRPTYFDKHFFLHAQNASLASNLDIFVIPTPVDVFVPH